MIDLLKLKTDLKTLKFGNDQPEYGSSGLPYVQTGIPNEPYLLIPELLGVTTQGVSLYRPGTTGNQDYPIRGGQIKFQIGQQTYTLSSEIDHFRIRKFLKDPKRGPEFINKQVGLQLSNPKIETNSATSFGFGEPNILPGLIENTRVYNRGRNTLAQVLVSGTGGHAIRHGNAPFAQFQRNYYYTVNEQNVLGGESGASRNRLVILNELKMKPGNNFINIDPSIDLNRVNTLGISLNKNLIFQYLGGPGSTYGIGSTSIRRTVDTSNLYLQNPRIPNEIFNNYEQYGKFNTEGQLLPSNKLNAAAETDPPLPNRLELLLRTKINSFDVQIDNFGNYKAFIPEVENNLNKWGISTNKRNLFFYPNGPGSITKGDDGKITVDKSQTDIRRYVDSTQIKSKSAMTYSKISATSNTVNKSVYNSIDSLENKGLTTAGKNREIIDFRQFVDTPTPMGTWTKRDSVDYRFYVENTKIDKLNRLFPFEFGNDKAPWELPIIDGKSTDDIIKFVFEAINNDDPTKSTALFFRAHLNGTITDNNNGVWNSFKYIGRGEEFYTYQGFTRSIGFSFTVYASSEQEMKPMYNRLNALVSQVYPDYSIGQGVMRAPMMRLTIGDYLYRMPGFLESVNLSIEQNSSWEIISDDTKSQLPHVVNVQVTFKPVPIDLPRRANSLNDPYAPSIIANKDGIIEPRINSDTVESVRYFDESRLNVNTPPLSQEIEERRSELSRENTGRLNNLRGSQTLRPSLMTLNQQEELQDFLSTGGPKNN